MILSSKNIRDEIRSGNIEISPFSERQLNPNSYNLRLAPDLMVYDEATLDAKRPARTRSFIIPENGFVFTPGTLYLARTVERTHTDRFVPMLEGRSSIGRLGVSIHVTAGFGDVGFNGFWTLEIHVVQPVRLYPGIEICQIYYHTIDTDNLTLYESGKYQNNTGIQPSLLYKELQN